MSLINTYPDISMLLAGYFNQDWMHEYASQEEVVSAFISENPPNLVENANAQLGQLMKVYPREKIPEMLALMCCEYYSEDLTSWLYSIKNTLEKFSNRH